MKSKFISAIGSGCERLDGPCSDVIICFLDIRYSFVITFTSMNRLSESTVSIIDEVITYLNCK